MTNCNEGDGFADQGFELIYIPQATVSSGLNNYYPVPSGAGPNTYNFKVDTLPNGTPDKLQIILGVYRSGKIDNASGFTVNVNVLQLTDDVLAEIDEEVDVISMPSSMYTIPGSASVEAGKNSTWFYLTVDIGQLLNGNYTAKKLALEVGISNPTNYKLCETGTSVVVIIDVDAISNLLNN